MIADVTIDEGLPDWGLSQMQWNMALEEVVSRFYPELINEHVKVRFTEKYFKALDVLMENDGAFDPPTQCLFINSFWVDKEGLAPLMCVAKIMSHELKHYVQNVLGCLDLQKANSYIVMHPMVAYDELPWEVEAIEFERLYRDEIHKIFLSYLVKTRCD